MEKGQYLATNKAKVRSRMSEFSTLSDSILPIKHPMERIEITDDMPQWKKDKIEATRKRVASLHKSKQDLIEGNASWSTVKDREMNEIRENIAENALGGAACGPLPFKRWLLNREHRLKLKEEENAKKEQMKRPNIKNLLMQVLHGKMDLRNIIMGLEWLLWVPLVEIK